MPDEIVLTVSFARIYARPAYKRSEKAIFLLKRKISRLAKVGSVKVSPELNEIIWERGDTLRRRNVKVRVKVNREEDLAEVEPFIENAQEQESKEENEKSNEFTK